MKLNYSVSRDDYKKIIAHTLKQKAATTKSRILFLLGTIGQMALVLGLILFYPLSTTQKVILGILSLAAAVRNYIAGRAFPLRSKLILSQMESNGQVHPEFWKKHSLKVKEDGIELIYGENEFLFPWENLAPAERDSEFFYLKSCTMAVLEGIPLSAFPENYADKLAEIISSHLTEAAS